MAASPLSPGSSPIDDSPQAPAVQAIPQSPTSLFVRFGLPAGSPSSGLSLRVIDTATRSTIDVPVRADEPTRYLPIDAAGKQLVVELRQRDRDEPLARSEPVQMPADRFAEPSGDGIWMTQLDGHLEPGALPDDPGWIAVSRLDDLPTSLPPDWLLPGVELRLARDLQQQWSSTPWRPISDRAWTSTTADGRVVTLRVRGARQLWTTETGGARIGYGPFWLRVENAAGDVEIERTILTGWAVTGGTPPREVGSGAAEAGPEPVDASVSAGWLEPRAGTRDGRRASSSPTTPTPATTASPMVSAPALATIERALATGPRGSSEHGILPPPPPGAGDAVLTEVREHVADRWRETGASDLPLRRVHEGVTTTVHSTARVVPIELLRFVPPTGASSSRTGGGSSAASSGDDTDTASIGSGRTTDAPSQFLGRDHDNSDLAPVLRPSTARIGASMTDQPAEPPAADADSTAPASSPVSSPVSSSVTPPPPVGVDPAAGDMPKSDPARALVLGLARGTMVVSVAAAMLVRAEPVWATFLMVVAIAALGALVYWRRRTNAVPASHIEPSLATIATGISAAVVTTLAIFNVTGLGGVIFIAVLLIAEWAFLRPLIDSDEGADKPAV